MSSFFEREKSLGVSCRNIQPKPRSYAEAMVCHINITSSRIGVL